MWRCARVAVVGLALLACARADDPVQRLRAWFDIVGAEEPDQLRVQLLAAMPPGTTEDALVKRFAHAGIGSGGRAGKWVRLENPHRFLVRTGRGGKGWVEHEYALTFLFAVNGRLNDIKVEKWLTGP